MPETDLKVVARSRLPHAMTKESTDQLELRPDGEERFRAAVHAAAKSGPKHRPGKDAKR